MEEIEELVNKIEIDRYAEHTEYWVDITHIVDPHCFYIRLTKHRVVVKKIQSLSPVLKPKTVSEQDIVLFNMSDDIKKPKYARGKVQLITQNAGNISYSLMALDYGFIKKITTLDKIWVCDYLLLNVPPLAQNCQLARCAPRGNTWGNAIKAFKDLIGKERAMMSVKEVTPSSLVVALYNTCPDDIATMLALIDITTFGIVCNDLKNKASQAIAPKKCAYFMFKSFKTNDTLHVRVISGKSLDGFYVADVSDYKTYLDKRKYYTLLSKREATIDESCVRCGDVVCVDDSYSIEKGYNRGVIKEIRNDKALVHLVDMGKEELLTFRRLRRVPEEYLSVPVVGIFCSVEDIHAWTNPYKILHPGRELLISIIKPGHEFVTANIIKITKLLN